VYDGTNEQQQDDYLYSTGIVSDMQSARLKYTLQDLHVKILGRWRLYCYSKSNREF